MSENRPDRDLEALIGAIIRHGAELHIDAAGGVLLTGFERLPADVRAAYLDADPRRVAEYWRSVTAGSQREGRAA